MEIANSIYAENSIILSDIYNNLGGLQFSQRNYTQGLKYLEKAAEIIKVNIGDTNERYLNIINNISRILLE